MGNHHIQEMKIKNWHWMLDCCIGILFLILNILILRAELKKRSNFKIVFLSKYNKVFSLLCIVFGVLIELFGVLVFAQV